MWYFAWILGVSLACALAVINAMWLELGDNAKGEDQVGDEH